MQKFTEIATKITTIKSSLAEAITAKGVETAPNAPFNTMISNISNITSGGSDNVPEVEEWIKPHDWPDIEAEPLEAGEIRMLVCDMFSDNVSVFLSRGAGASKIIATIDWGDGTVDEVSATSITSYTNHTFAGNGTPSDRGYNTYVVKIKFSEPNSAPKQINLYTPGGTSSLYKYNGILWIYGDAQYLTSLINLNAYNYTYSNLVERINLINTNNVTNMSNVFSGCRSLISVPQLDISGISDANNLFYNCHSLKSIPPIDTSNITNMSNMFYNCSLLTSIPELNTSKVTSMSSMFYGCSALTSIPNLDTSKVTNMSSMFYGCSSLISIPDLDTSSATSLDSIFYGCSSLKYAPLINTSNATNVSRIFYNCYSLTKTYPIDTTKAVGSYTSNYYHFNNCSNLIEIGTITLSKDIKLEIGSSSSKIPLIKLDFAYDELDPPAFTQATPIKINYTQLSAEALNKIMEQLPPGNGKTLDLKYNQGSSTCDKTIATAKNWVVSV